MSTQEMVARRGDSGQMLLSGLDPKVADGIRVGAGSRQIPLGAYVTRLFLLHQAMLSMAATGGKINPRALLDELELEGVQS